MKANNMLALVLLISSSLANAENDDCMFSSNGLNKEFIIENTSKPSITFNHSSIYFMKSGDLLIANIDDCGLGKEGILLTNAQMMDSNDRKAKVIELASSFYSKGNEVVKLVSESQFNVGNTTFESEDGSEHIFKIDRIQPIDYLGNSFSNVITYTWFAPEGLE